MQLCGLLPSLRRVAAGSHSALAEMNVESGAAACRPNRRTAPIYFYFDLNVLLPVPSAAVLHCDSPPTQAMILLESKNPIIEQLLLDRFEMAANNEFISTNLTMSDFDGASYTIRNPGNALTLEQQQQQNGRLRSLSMRRSRPAAEEDEAAAPADIGTKNVLLITLKLYGDSFRELQAHGVDEASATPVSLHSHTHRSCTAHTDRSLCRRRTAAT